MNIRTITIGLSTLPGPAELVAVGQQLNAAERHFSAQGLHVQTRRIALPHWESGLGLLPSHDRKHFAFELDRSCRENAIDFCSLGIARSPEHISDMAGLIASTQCLSGGVDAADPVRGIDLPALEAAAQAVIVLAHETGDGFGNFRFGAGFCLPPDIPYFPGAYHTDRRASFSVGLENSDLLVQGVRSAKSFVEAEHGLQSVLDRTFRSLEAVCLEFEKIASLPFAGIDTSIAPSLTPEHSIVRAFGELGVTFGRPGTLALCGLVTKTVKSIPVRKAGYCGLMLPVLEDVGLSQSADQAEYTVGDLMRFSSVCAVGIDMVPLPGNAPLASLIGLMLDTATLSVRLSKPLCFRVLPVPGKKAGELTSFESPFICNCRIFDL